MRLFWLYLHAFYQPTAADLLCRRVRVPCDAVYACAAEVRDFWRCCKCGYMFETLRLIDAEQRLPMELAEEFFPSLLIA